MLVIIHYSCTICYILVRLKRSQRQFASGVSENINREIQILSAVIVLTDVVAFVGVTSFSLLFLQSGLIKWNKVMAIMVVLLYANTAIDPVIYIYFRLTMFRLIISRLNNRIAQLRTPLSHNVQHVQTIRNNSANVNRRRVEKNTRG